MPDILRFVYSKTIFVHTVKTTAIDKNIKNFYVDKHSFTDVFVRFFFDLF